MDLPKYRQAGCRWKSEDFFRYEPRAGSMYDAVFILSDSGFGFCIYKGPISVPYIRRSDGATVVMKFYHVSCWSLRLLSASAHDVFFSFSFSSRR